MIPRGSGELDTPVSFFKRTDAVDAAGGPAPHWDVKAFWGMAKEETGSAGEQSTSDQDAAFARVVFWIRWRSDVSVTMRVMRDGQLFDVKAADAVGRRKWLRIVGEKVNDG